jgi:hypothetical protein
MSQATGQIHLCSYFRRLVTDLMHFSAKVPSVTIERRMDLAPLVAARQACMPPPTWSAIFTKAYALVEWSCTRRSAAVSFLPPRPHQPDVGEIVSDSMGNHPCLPRNERVAMVAGRPAGSANSMRQSGRRMFINPHARFCRGEALTGPRRWQRWRQGEGARAAFSPAFEWCFSGNAASGICGVSFNGVRGSAKHR